MKKRTIDNLEPVKEFNICKIEDIYIYDEGKSISLSNIIKRNNIHKKYLFFSNCIFHDKLKLKYYDLDTVYFNNCLFEEELTLKGESVKYEFIFNNCIFIEKVDFEQTVFTNYFDFSRSIFYKGLNLKNTTFDNKTSFNDVVLNYNIEFDLRDTYIKNTIKFLDISTKKIEYFNVEEYSSFQINKKIYELKKQDYLNVKNRETARIIKDSFEQQNNIIEANKFYALEMKEREKELKKDIKKGKNIFEWLIFKVHGLSSNHSQDWLLSLFWIIIISFVVGVFNQEYFYWVDKYIFIYLILLVPLIIGVKFDGIKRNISLSLFIVSFYSFTSINLDFVANLVNPFSIMTGKESLTFGTLIFKITIVYLIYQLIVSIRQNTRRK